MLNPNDIQIPFIDNVPFTLDSGVRDLRNKLLNENIDTMNPIRYASLTDEQKTEIAAYRQALLDVPQQTGWPITIEWPTKPNWL